MGYLPTTAPGTLLFYSLGLKISVRMFVCVLRLPCPRLHLANIFYLCLSFMFQGRHGLL